MYKILKNILNLLKNGNTTDNINILEEAIFINLEEANL